MSQQYPWWKRPPSSLYLVNTWCHPMHVLCYIAHNKDCSSDLVLVQGHRDERKNSLFQSSIPQAFVNILIPRPTVRKPDCYNVERFQHLASRSVCIYMYALTPSLWSEALSSSSDSAAVSPRVLAPPPPRHRQDFQPSFRLQFRRDESSTTVTRPKAHPRDLLPSTEKQLPFAGRSYGCI